MITAKCFNMNISRNNFLNKSGRMALLFMLALIVFILGGRIAGSSSCNQCPGRGLCKGEDDCTKYLPGGK